MPYDDTLVYIVGASYGKLLMVPLVRTLGDRCGVELVVQLDVELLGTLLEHLLRHVHLSVELLWLEEKQREYATRPATLARRRHSYLHRNDPKPSPLPPSPPPPVTLDAWTRERVSKH